MNPGPHAHHPAAADGVPSGGSGLSKMASQSVQSRQWQNSAFPASRGILVDKTHAPEVLRRGAGVNRRSERAAANISGSDDVGKCFGTQCCRHGFMEEPVSNAFAPTSARRDMARCAYSWNALR